jgi:hypothetical protein
MVSKKRELKSMIVTGRPGLLSGAPANLMDTAYPIASSCLFRRGLSAVEFSTENKIAEMASCLVSVGRIRSI